jgi:uncharacterized protein
MRERVLLVLSFVLCLLIGNLITPTGTSRAQRTATPTPDPYADVYLDALTRRSYGGGELVITKVMTNAAAFTRYEITYPSDGLTIYGFMNVPKSNIGKGPFPVIIALHGYIDPAIYNTLDYTTRYADNLARAGYLVIHPNLRGYRPSDDGPNAFRTGFAIDVLNLIEIVKAQGGKPGSLQQAIPSRIGLWGHSMGGGVSIRVLTISRDVLASVLYGSMNGDELLNYQMIGVWTNGARGKEERATPADVLARISPSSYLDRIQAAVSIHHGEADAQVPPAWSRTLCSNLQTLGKTVECFNYARQPHTFQGASDTLFMQKAVTFYNKYLKATP